MASLSAVAQQGALQGAQAAGQNGLPALVQQGGAQGSQGAQGAQQGQGGQTAEEQQDTYI